MFESSLTPNNAMALWIYLIFLGWVPYNIEFDIKRCLMAYNRIMGTCPVYINEQLELNNSQHSRNTQGANLTILPRRYIREKDVGLYLFM